MLALAVTTTAVERVTPTAAVPAPGRRDLAGRNGARQ
jgi:hypothetical protein